MSSSRSSRSAFALALLVSLLWSLPSFGLTLHVPLETDAIALPGGDVLCGAAPEGWVPDPARHRLRPPAQARVGQAVVLTIAPTASGCGTEASRQATAVVTGPIPAVDASTVLVSVDAGRLELHGDRLEGARVSWKAGDKAGSDTCVAVTKDKGHDYCVVRLDKGLPADPRRISLRIAPAGGVADPETVTYDHTGSALPDDQMRLPVARLFVSHVFPAAHTVDLTSGQGKIDLVNAEAVASAECGAARCEIDGASVVVRGVPAASDTVTLKLRLLPRVFLARGDAQDGTPTESFSVLRCPLAVASGPPLRNVDNLQVLLRIDRACGMDAARMRFTANGDLAEVMRSETVADANYVLLWIGRTAGERLTIVASRPEDGSVLGVTSEQTHEAPQLVTSLLLPGIGQIDFIPKNRDALLTVPPISTGTIVPVSVPGAYVVEAKKDGYHLRGVYTSGGYTSLRFAYRATRIPAAFADADLAILVDPVQRPIRQANVPAPLGASSVTRRPIIELICSFGSGSLKSVPAGTSPHIPFSERDSCRLVIHRDRFPPEDGEQRLTIDVSVSNASGGERSEAKVAHHLVLGHGTENDVIWLRGAKEQFDRISVHVTHEVDESQYLGRSSKLVELPSAQWTVTTEDAHFRFYATATIPASLYRFSSDPQNLGSGPLTLNFGVISRLARLDSEGHEQLLGLETGVLAMGLATDKERQLALVGGLGISIPLGNVNQPTQASVNIHGWAAYTLGEREGVLTNDAGNATGKVTLSPWGFVFGPSITIGNVGAFL